MLRIRTQSFSSRVRGDRYRRPARRRKRKATPARSREFIPARTLAFCRADRPRLCCSCRQYRTRRRATRSSHHSTADQRSASSLHIPCSMADREFQLDLYSRAAPKFTLVLKRLSWDDVRTIAHFQNVKGQNSSEAHHLLTNELTPPFRLSMPSNLAASAPRSRHDIPPGRKNDPLQFPPPVAARGLRRTAQQSSIQSVGYLLRAPSA